MIRSDFSRLFDLLAEACRIVESIDESEARRVRIVEVPSLVPTMSDLASLGPFSPNDTSKGNATSYVTLTEAAPETSISLFMPLLE